MKRYVKSFDYDDEDIYHLILYRDFAEKVLDDYIKDAHWVESNYGLHQDYDDYNYWLSGDMSDIDNYIRDFHLNDYEDDDMWRISEDKYGNSYSSQDKPNM